MQDILWHLALPLAVRGLPVYSLLYVRRDKGQLPQEAFDMHCFLQ